MSVKQFKERTLKGKFDKNRGSTEQT